MRVWIGWTYHESTYRYGTALALSRIGDQGRAYGQYQFDYRYGLVPFMQTCINFNANTYGAFQEYVDLGAGNPGLVNNTPLHNLFITYANNRRKEFLYLQDSEFMTQYLNPVLSVARGMGLQNLDNPYIIGTLGSFAIRDGSQGSTTISAIQAMLSGTDIEDVLYRGYGVFDQRYSPDTRWSTQFVECVSDMANFRNVVNMGGNPPKSKKSKIWMWEVFQ